MRSLSKLDLFYKLATDGKFFKILPIILLAGLTRCRLFCAQMDIEIIMLDKKTDIAIVKR